MLGVLAGWCGYCKKMDSSTWKSEALVSYLDEHKIVPVRIDPDNPIIYWLDVSVQTEEGTQFGWKTRQYPDHFMDDAVYGTVPNPAWEDSAERSPSTHSPGGDSTASSTSVPSEAA